VRGRILKIIGPGRYRGPVRAEGAITRVDGRFRLELVVRAADSMGTRTLEAKACDDLAGAAAVELGLLVHSFEATRTAEPAASQPAGTSSVGSGDAGGAAADASAASSAGATGESGGTPPAGMTGGGQRRAEGDAERATSEGDARGSRATPPRRWRLLVQAPVGAFAIGSLPKPGVGWGVAAGIEVAAWRFQLMATSWLGQNVSATSFPGYGADVERRGANLLTCRGWRWSWLDLSPCLTVGIARASASGTGAAVMAIRRHATLASAGGGIQARKAVTSWLRLVTLVAVEAQFVRPRLAIDGLGPLDPEARASAPPVQIVRFAPASLTATLGLEWAL